MSLLITLSSDFPHWKDKNVVDGAPFLTTLLLALTLWRAHSIKRIVCNTGINIATRVIAPIVASLGVHFIITGLNHPLLILHG